MSRLRKDLKLSIVVALLTGACSDPCETLEASLCDEAPQSAECSLIREGDRRAQLSRTQCERILAARAGQGGP